MGKRLYIMGAAQCGMQKPHCAALEEEYDFIIAADGGYETLLSQGITPDLVVGDFDSLGYLPQHPNVISSPAEKDDTDMLLAVKQGLERGYKTIVIEGGLGGRLDHTFANIQVLVYIAKNNASGYCIGQDMCVTAITDGTVSFRSGLSGGISVFSADSMAEGVTLTGLKYSADNIDLTNSYPIGVSNEFTGAPASISVRAGTLIVIWAGKMGDLTI